MTMRIVVTGANGYIGAHVVRALLRRGVDVLAWDFATNRLPKGVAARQDDLFSAHDLPACDALLHLAWQDGFRHNAPSHALCLSGHFDFVRRMVLAGCRQVAVMGSMHEVGYHEGMLSEDTPCRPTTLYAIAKDALRRMLTAWVSVEAPDCAFQWMRAFYLYGDDGSNHSVFTKLLQAEAEGRMEFPFVTGDNAYDFLDVRELAEMVAATICQRTVTGIIHLCSGRPQRLRERAEAFIRENGLAIRLRPGAFPDRPYDSPCLYGDPAKIRAILGREGA